MADYINPQISLSEYISSYRVKLKEEIEVIKVLWRQEEELMAHFAERYAIKPIVIGTPYGTTPIKKEANEVKGTKEYFEVKAMVPYSGNKNLFNCKPVGYARSAFPHRHELYSGMINVYIPLDNLDPQSYTKEMKKFMAELVPNIERVNSQISFYNDELPDLIKLHLNKKRKELQKQASFMEQVGLKMNAKSDEYMIPEPIKRRVVPTPAKGPTSNSKTYIAPSLQTSVYNDIKSVLYHVGTAIERKPSLFKGKHEEDLRDIFLLFLETRYEATSGIGEAFNKSGKTDILLKYAVDGSNLFIAECKIWKGKKNLLQAIDQLLSYLTHRDSKAALMIFVRQQDFSTVLQSAKLFATQHPQFVRFNGITFDTSFSYMFCLPNDPGSLILVEFMLFHFPEP